DDERPYRQRGQRRPADHLDVGGAPGRHVLAEDAVPHVVERKPGEGDDAAQREQHPADGDVPAAAAPERAARLPGVAEDDGEDAGEGGPGETDDDEPVRRVGERARVATAVNVPRDIPVVAERGGEQGGPGDGLGDGGPARNPGPFLDKRTQSSEWSE